MRFMMIVKSSQACEEGRMPSEEMISAMTRYNEELIKAGVLVDLSGLQPSSKGARVRYSAGKRVVIDGPFTETKELIGGYWIIRADSLEEAIEWAKRAPMPQENEYEAEIEVRPFFEMEDFPPSRAVDEAKKLGEELVRSRG